MNRIMYPARVLLLGLLTAQIIAMLHVYLVNLELYQFLAVIRDNGYLAIPNHYIAETLKEFKPAFCGGVFFTLTVGAGLSVLSFICVWIWDRLFLRHKYFFIPVFVFWAACIIRLNIKSISPLITLYFLFVPAVTGFFTVKWMPGEKENKDWINPIILCAPLALSLLIWSTQVDKYLFIDFRDHILLSNSIGKAINDYYYKYTLYPANAIKSLEQKNMKTCYLERVENDSFKRYLAGKMAGQNFLIIDSADDADLTLSQNDQYIYLMKGDKTVLQAETHKFVSNLQSVLKEYSTRCDDQLFFKKMIKYSLLIGLPITLYIVLLSIIYFLFQFFLSVKKAEIAAAGVCLLIAGALLIPFQYNRSHTVAIQDVSGALASGHIKTRIEALRTVYKNRLDIGEYHAYKPLIHSGNITEKYWLAKVLGYSRQPETYQDILLLLDDPHPNVVCMAFQAMGRRGQKPGIDEILKRINTSQHWYEQWYAYKALKDLGWKEKKSILKY